jgi:hypothetical protein
MHFKRSGLWVTLMKTMHVRPLTFCATHEQDQEVCSWVGVHAWEYLLLTLCLLQDVGVWKLQATGLLWQILEDGIP